MPKTCNKCLTCCTVAHQADEVLALSLKFGQSDKKHYILNIE
ncbi:hypothetical protein [Desulfovibrio litoralis]|nr:hypothetical protein [Desulfovibrio litoralis]